MTTVSLRDYSIVPPSKSESAYSTEISKISRGNRSLRGIFRNLRMAGSAISHEFIFFLLFIRKYTSIFKVFWSGASPLNPKLI